MIPFGKRIRTLRDERNWSQAQLAVKLGLSNSQIAHYESEDRLPSLQVVVRASHVFGVTTDYLLGLDEDRSSFLDISGLSSNEIDIVNKIVDSYKSYHKQK